ncbi:MAG: PIN domain-containing protein [Saprospiraceae bacterium]
MTTILIFDTNVWLYLANSKDPLTENFQEGHHFILLEKLLNKIDQGVIQLVSNEIIEKEWNRNKMASRDLVCRYERKLENELRILESIGKSLGGQFAMELDLITTAYKDSFKSKIHENNLHIAKVEQLLKSCTKFEVSLEIKAFASDWAVDEFAPFTTNKNSMADALILFSAIDYIKSKESVIEHPDGDWTIRPRSIFVSANKNDFSSPNDKFKIHEHLKGILDSVNMKYFISLPGALQRVDETLFEDLELLDKIDAEIEDYLQTEEYCHECDVDPEKPIPNYIVFYPPEEIINESITNIDPNQLQLFENIQVPENIIKTIQRGFCNNCDSEHIKCQKCNTTISLNNIDEVFDCPGCDLTYEITSTYVGEGLFEETIKIVSALNEDHEKLE